MGELALLDWIETVITVGGASLLELLEHVLRSTKLALVEFGFQTLGGSVSTGSFILRAYSVPNPLSLHELLDNTCHVAGDKEGDSCARFPGSNKLMRHLNGEFDADEQWELNNLLWHYDVRVIYDDEGRMIEGWGVAFEPGAK